MFDLSPIRLRPICLLLPLTLAACGGSGRYPSLAQRPAERAYSAFTAATPPPAPAPQAPGSPDPATLHQVTALRADAAHANETFAQHAEEAGHLTQAAHGTSLGSEAWAAATIAMATLDSARSDTALALGDLDALRVRTAVTAAQTNDANGVATYAAVAQADGEVAAILKKQDAQIASLHKVMEN